MEAKVSVVTPWLNGSELIPIYLDGLTGAEIVAVDNGSSAEHAEKIRAMANVYIRNEENLGFAHANNQGLAAASGEIILFLNNDVSCGWAFLGLLSMSVTDDNALYGVSKLRKHNVPYLEGWCIYGLRSVWERLGGWDEDYTDGFYWTDNDLGFRAALSRIKLIEVALPVYHYSNYTSRQYPRLYEQSAENERKFVERVEGYYQGRYLFEDNKFRRLGQDG